MKRRISLPRLLGWRLGRLRVLDAAAPLTMVTLATIGVAVARWGHRGDAERAIFNHGAVPERIRRDAQQEGERSRRCSTPRRGRGRPESRRTTPTVPYGCTTDGRNGEHLRRPPQTIHVLTANTLTDRDLSVRHITERDEDAVLTVIRVIRRTWDATAVRVKVHLGGSDRGQKPVLRPRTIDPRAPVVVERLVPIRRPGGRMAAGNHRTVQRRSGRRLR